MSWFFCNKFPLGYFISGYLLLICSLSFFLVKSEKDKAPVANLPKSQDSLCKSPVEVPVELSSMHPRSMPNLDSSHLSNPVINGMGLNSDSPTTESNTKGAGVNHESADQNKETKESDTSKNSRIPTIDVNTLDHGQEVPFPPDQSLKRERDRGTQESGRNVQDDDRNVLKRSGSSAFSRYGDSQAPPAIVNISSVQNFFN